MCGRGLHKSMNAREQGSLGPSERLTTVDYHTWAEATGERSSQSLCLHLNLCKWCPLIFGSVRPMQWYLAAQVPVSDQVLEIRAFVFSTFALPVKNSFIRLCSKHL